MEVHYWTVGEPAYYDSRAGLVKVKVLGKVRDRLLVKVTAYSMGRYGYPKNLVFTANGAYVLTRDQVRGMIIVGQEKSARYLPEVAEQ